MRSFIAIAACAILAGSGVAQNPQPTTGRLQIPPTAGINQPGMGVKKAEKALQGMERVRYLLKQLGLSAEQLRNAEGLAESAFSNGAPEGTEPTINLNEIRSIMTELENEQAAGNKVAVERITAELKARGERIKQESTPDYSSEREKEFFANLERTLTESQKASLKDALARLAGNPSGALRPVDVLRAARNAEGIDGGQSQKLAAVEARFRTEINTRDPQATTAEGRRTKLLDGLIEEARGILTPAQSKAFDDQLANMRPRSA